MPTTIRAFVACELPHDLRKAIGEIQRGIKSRGIKMKWVKENSIHLTLKFLGDIEQKSIPSISECLRHAAKGFSPLSLCAQGIGVFPNLKRPRVAWVGIGGELGKLTALQHQLNDVLESVGFAKEKRSFKGHLTFARIKAPIDPSKLLDVLKAHNGFSSETFTVDRLILYESDLQPGGAVYTQRVTVEL